jgi:hypothetical protein
MCAMLPQNACAAGVSDPGYSYHSLITSHF